MAAPASGGDEPATAPGSAPGPESANGNGAALFARYAYPPNELGYCGPGDGRDLLEYVSAAADVTGEAAELDMVGRARAFDGASPYLEYLATIAGAESIMDQRVVEAYWVGNDLLREGDAVNFAGVVRAAFASQLGADWPALAPDVAPHPLPHHSFHVFTIYPWVGVLRRTGADAALGVLDRCRIRWGRVETVDGDAVDVQCQPLTWDGATLRLGTPRLERARLASAGHSLAAGVRRGKWVSLHWDWVCDELSAAQLAALIDATDRQLTITNRATCRGRCTPSSASVTG
jgi:hypothetical protein